MGLGFGAEGGVMSYRAVVRLLGTAGLLVRVGVGLGWVGLRLGLGLGLGLGLSC